MPHLVILYTPQLDRDTDMGAFDKTVEVNIRGYFYMSMKAGNLMKRQTHGGSIVNTASINGVKPGLFQGIYSATKAAQLSLAEIENCAAGRISKGLEGGLAFPGRLICNRSVTHNM